MMHVWNKCIVPYVHNSNGDVFKTGPYKDAPHSTMLVVTVNRAFIYEFMNLLMKMIIISKGQ